MPTTPRVVLGIGYTFRNYTLLLPLRIQSLTREAHYIAVIVYIKCYRTQKQGPLQIFCTLFAGDFKQPIYSGQNI